MKNTRVRTKVRRAERFFAAVLCTALALGLPLLAAQSKAKPAPAEPVIAIVGATLIDGNGGPAVPDSVVVVTGKRITAVGPRASVKLPAGTKVIDGKGKFVTPGFIDTNVHLSLYGAGETFVRYEPQNADLVYEAAQLSLKYGITTVRDSYGSLPPLVQVRDEINRGEKAGARILCAGNIVGWGGPYSITFSLIPDTNLTLFQEQVNDVITQGAGENLIDMTPEELRAAINRYLDRGPDFIKYGGTSHFSSPLSSGSPPRHRRSSSMKPTSGDTSRRLTPRPRRFAHLAPGRPRPHSASRTPVRSLSERTGPDDPGEEGRLLDAGELDNREAWKKHLKDKEA